MLLERLLDIREETELLIQIKDIREEIKIIRSVLDIQEEVLKEMLKGNNDRPYVLSSPAPMTLVARNIGEFTRMEGQAAAVQDKVFVSSCHNNIIY
jgi:hypothetical protein